MTLTQARRLALALTAQVVLCLSFAPVLAAEQVPTQPSEQRDRSQQGGATIQAARDAANARPEEVSDSERKTGRPRLSTSRTLSATRARRLRTACDEGAIESASIASVTQLTGGMDNALRCPCAGAQATPQDTTRVSCRLPMPPQSAFSGGQGTVSWASIWVEARSNRLFELEVASLLASDRTVIQDPTWIGQGVQPTGPPAA